MHDFFERALQRISVIRNKINFVHSWRETPLRLSGVNGSEGRKTRPKNRDPAEVVTIACFREVYRIKTLDRVP